MREFLKGLFDDEETIDTIMAEYGKNFSKLKEENEALHGKISEYENTIGELNKTIESNNQTLENLQNITNENKDLKAQLQMSDSHVKKEFSKFVTSEIMSQVDDENDFASVLENYKNENPQYFGDTVVKKVQSSVSLTSSEGNQPRTTNDIMNDVLRSAKDE